MREGRAQQNACMERLCHSPSLLSAVGLTADSLQDILRQPFCPAPILSADPRWHLPQVCSALCLAHHGSPDPLPDVKTELVLSRTAPGHCSLVELTFLNPWQRRLDWVALTSDIPPDDCRSGSTDISSPKIETPAQTQREGLWQCNRYATDCLAVTSLEAIWSALQCIPLTQSLLLHSSAEWAHSHQGVSSLSDV